MENLVKSQKLEMKLLRKGRDLKVTWRQNGLGGSPDDQKKTLRGRKAKEKISEAILLLKYQRPSRLPINILLSRCLKLGRRNLRALDAERGKY